MTFNKLFRIFIHQLKLNFGTGGLEDIDVVHVETLDLQSLDVLR